MDGFWIEPLAIDDSRATLHACFNEFSRRSSSNETTASRSQKVPHWERLMRSRCPSRRRFLTASQPVAKPALRCRIRALP